LDDMMKFDVVADDKHGNHAAEDGAKTTIITKTVRIQYVSNVLNT
jgi:hypothetical protein